MHKNESPPFICQICEKGFFLEFSLKKHNKIDHKSRLLTCGYGNCDLQFTLIIALLNHKAKDHRERQKRNFTCRICNISFESRKVIKSEFLIFTVLPSQEF